MEIQHAPDKAAGYYGQSEISQVPGINHRLTGHDRFRDAFHGFAHRCAQVTGSAGAFLIAGLVIVVWLVMGPIFKFSDTWQLVINTATTIITFLMVFLIQNTQNRDARALHLKIDELLRAVGEARTGLVNLEKLSEAELDDLEAEFERVRTRACRAKDEEVEQVHQPEASP
jgi:low affinity Fe/Cu permease